MAASRISRFMSSVLGDEAAGALAKAAERSDTIDSILGPRTILGWLSCVSRWPYEGEIPGLPGTYLRFQKSDTYEGEIRFGKDSYEFKDADITHVAAAMSCALGVDQPVAKGLRDSELLALGENIDLLVKTQVAIHAEESSEETSEESSVEKFDEPGTPHVHETKTPDGFTATAPSTNKGPKRRTGKSVFLGRSEVESKCSVCERTQFRGDIFKGCACIQDLAKHATAELVGDKVRVSFDPDYWTDSDVKLFLEIVGGE